MKIISRSYILKAAALFSSVIIANAEEKRPNILFIFADDYAYDCLHAHGNDRVETPNLDKLSARSTHFTHAYNSGAWNGAVCVASRTMMMTGNQLWKAKDSKLNKLSDEKKLFPQLMQAAGYDTYFAGKWHVATDAKKAWGNAVNIRKGMPNQSKHRYTRKFIKGESDTWDPTDTKEGGFWQGGKHWSEVVADDGANYFKQVAKSENPFLMMLCFNAPHDPRQAPAEYQKKYPYDSIEVPESFQPLYPYDFGANKIRDEKLAPFPRTPYSIQVNRSEYYALISHMDTQIGKILKSLEESGKADNTYIIFTADHGLACGQHGMLGKQNQYEHSVRVPWLISGPSIPKGKQNKSPIYLQDAMATCLDLADVKAPDYVEFDSVLPLVKNASHIKKDIYGSYLNVQRMVTHDGFKLIIYPQAKKLRLFNLTKDPTELKDISADKASKPIIDKCRAALIKQMDKMGDPLDRKKLTF